MSKRRNQQQRAAARGRRKVRRQRRRGGVASVVLGPNDGAVVFRSSGRLQFHNSRAEPVPNTGAFWLHIMRWLFADGKDAAERRQILTDDFLLDMQEHAAAVRKAAVEAEAKDRAIAEIAGMDDEPEMTDERVEELVAELLPKYIKEVEAELEAREQRTIKQSACEPENATREEIAEAVRKVGAKNDRATVDESIENGGENPLEPIETESEDDLITPEDRDGIDPASMISGPAPDHQCPTDVGVVANCDECLEGPDGECPHCGDPHGPGAGCPGTPEREGGPI